MFFYRCTCGSEVFRIYYSRNLAECHQCLKQYKIDEVLGKIEIKHQRG